MTAPRINSEDLAHPLLSVVVPMYNEEHGVSLLFKRLIPILEAVTTNFEVICIDDGSSDRTVFHLTRYRTRDQRVKVISLSRNFGKDVALSAGLDYATGQAVIPIDADLQDPPELIPDMVAKWREGYEVVYARRVDRSSDTAHKRLTAGLFYRVYNWLADVRIPDNTGDFRLMDRRVVEVIKNLPEKTRFMKGVFAWVGFRQIGIDFVRESRATGVTKWRSWRLWNFALDGITSSSTLPLRIWTYLGLGIALLSFAAVVWLVMHTLAYGNSVPGYASLMVAVVFLGGLNIAATGILGEYIGRIYSEVRNRPLYVLREVHGLRPTETGDHNWNAAFTSVSTNSSKATGGSVGVAK